MVVSEQHAGPEPALEPQANQAKVRLLSTDISALGFAETVTTLITWAKQQQRAGKVVCMANVHMLVEAHGDPDFSSVLRRANLVIPDGMPLVWLMRRAGAINQERVAGMDLLPALCGEAERESIGVYFLGDTPAVLGKIRQRLSETHPKLRVAGMESPPFRDLSPADDTAIVGRINQADVGLVFVALGCPKQERWMGRNQGRVRAVMVGLGAALPVYAGIRRRAPRYMQRNGLEWLFRLAQEPRRLWKRYLTTNLRFLGWVIRDARRAQGESPLSTADRNYVTRWPRPR